MYRFFSRAGWALMALLALLVGLVSLRFLSVPLTGTWPRLDPDIRQAIASIPVSALLHLVVAPLALIVGPVQFLPRLRERHRGLHRTLGKIYVAACVAAGIGGLVMAFHASGGVIAGVGFGLLAVCWIGTTLGAWVAAMRRRIALHQLLMRFSYAMTFGAVTLRLQIPIGIAFLGFHSYSEMSVWLAYTSWIPNVLVVAIYSLLRHRKPHSPNLQWAGI